MKWRLPTLSLPRISWPQLNLAPWQELLPKRKPKAVNPALYDGLLLACALGLMMFGLIMVLSASTSEATRLFDNPYHFAIRHAIFLCLALLVAGAILHLPIHYWQQYSHLLLWLALVLLIAVLIVGKSVNGSTRWLSLGPINLQVAEVAKLFFFTYLADYLVRRHDQVREDTWAFIKPLAVFALIAILLLVQPDLGTVVVMLVATLGMLFLAGAPVWQFVAVLTTGVSVVSLLIWLSPYRLRRVTSFWDPWADPFGSGYQLTQSLMAFGRGGLSGEGLGNSVQKLAYLPEAHTDFVIAILAEELGFIGVAAIISLLALLVYRCLLIGRNALQQGHLFEGLLASGIGIWLCFQGVVNVGASAGLLPTKGLTLPLVSYGGSSMIILSVGIAIVLRIDHEMRLKQVQAISRGQR